MSTPKEVHDAVVNAYYGRLMTSSESARLRAQAGYGIASAIAAGVIAAGLFGRLYELSAGVQIVAVAALVAWLVGAALFLHTVSSWFERELQPQMGQDAFVEAALEAIREERRQIDVWQRRAQIASAIAALLTVCTFVAAIEADHSPAARAATVTLTADGAAALRRSCGPMPTNLRSALAGSTLRERFVEMTLDPGMCGPEKVEVAIPRDHLLTVAFRRALRP